MHWNELSERFLLVRKNGDCDAEWRFAPDEAGGERWTLVEAPGAREIKKLLIEAGTLLRDSVAGTRVLPSKLVAANVPPLECWLGALRRRRINTVKYNDTAWRVDAGRVEAVAAASVMLCTQLHGTPSIRSSRRAAYQAPLSMETLKRSARRGRGENGPWAPRRRAGPVREGEGALTASVRPRHCHAPISRGS